MRLNLFALSLMLLFAFTIAPTQVQGQNKLFNGFKSLIEKVQTQTQKFMGKLDDRLDKLVTGVKNFTRSLKEVAHCYEAEINGQRMHIFDHAQNFKNVTSMYYHAFPNKNITKLSIECLLNSTRDMITRCIDPKRRPTHPHAAKFGYTSLSDRSDEEIRRMLGVIVPEGQEDGATAPAPVRSKRLSGSDAACKVNTNTTLPKAHDWRAQNAVTSVRDQGPCGSCWTFATAGSIESALVRTKKAPLTLALSEQQIVNCAKTSGCSGGNSYTGFNFVKTKGIANNASRPYSGKAETCNTGLPVAFRIKDFCLRSKYRYTTAKPLSLTEALTDDTIARAIHQHGPLYAVVDANPGNYRNYRSGVMDVAACTTKINHAILLVGFNVTENSWIIKNSWGPAWGEKGFFKLVRGKNMCGVNTEIAWPVL